MIKLDENFYIKNVKKPTKLEITVMAGITDHHYCSAKTSTISLVPTDYQPGGAKSTGLIVEDLYRYIGDVMDKIISDCYFDLTTSDGQAIAKRFSDKYGKKLKENLTDENKAAKIFSPFKSIVEDCEILNAIKFTPDNIFGVMIQNVESDIEMIGDIEEISKFLLFFSGSDFNAQAIDQFSRLKSNYLNANRNIGSFINILIRIFFFFLSQDSRNITTAIAVNVLNTSTRKALTSDVMLWDNKMKKYYAFNRDIIRDQVANSYFATSKICSNINNYYIINTDYPEISNILDLRKTTYDSEDVFISKTAESVFGVYKPYGKDSNSSKIFSYQAYAAYKNKDNKGEAIGVSLYGTLKNSKRNMMALINVLAFSKEPLEIFQKSDFKDAVNSLSYSDSPLDISIQSLIDKDMIKFECDICYFTRGGGKTKYWYSELQDKKIPKQRRDLIFKTICYTCYELDLNPLDILKDLDVDFKRHYSSPISIT